jgi:hypothetical protein
MAFKVFAPGVLTSSDVNTFLMRQAVITCTSTTRPASPNEGMTIYETNTDTFKVYDGANWIDFGRSVVESWQTYTPTLSGGWALGNGTINGRFHRVGKIVTVYVGINFGSTSTYGTGPAGLTVSLPVSTVLVTQPHPADLVDVSAGRAHIAVAQTISATTVELNALNTTFANGAYESVINTKPFTWATDDAVRIIATYEAA